MKELMSKTRKILVDTARQLFAQKGIDNTTMNNIALASGKGRRTLYTYFRSKTEVYQAVIESELSHLIHQLGDVVGRDLPPDEKLMCIRDRRKVETARKNIDRQELEFLGRIIDDGIKKGIFRPTPLQPTSWVIHCCLKGLEIPYLKGVFSDMGFDSGKLKEFIADMTKSCLGCEKYITE